MCSFACVRASSFISVHVCVCVCVCECEHVCMTVSLESPTGSKFTIQKGSFSLCLQPQCICECTPHPSTASLVHYVMFHFLENRYRNIYIRSCLFC